MRSGFVVTTVAVFAVSGCLMQNRAPIAIDTRERLRGVEIERLFSGATVSGWAIKPEMKFVERYEKNGHYFVAIANDSPTQENSEQHKGTWRVENDKICYTTSFKLKSGCSVVYKRSIHTDFAYPNSVRRYAYAYEIMYENDFELPSGLPHVQGEPNSSAAITQPKTLEPVGSGSGLVVSSQTYVLTNAHVIENCKVITATLAGKDIQVAATLQDRRNDLALLRLPAGANPVAIFQKDDGLFPGDTVLAIGYPLSEILASEGNVSVGTVSALAGLGNNTSLLQISNPIQPGNSGGPLFDMSGHVVGVVVSKLSFAFALEAYGTLPQNVNFAVKSSVATEFMRASGVNYQARKSTRELRPSDVAREGRPVTVPVTCWE